MARRARVVVPGFLYHVTQRGNYQQKVFQSHQDRAIYLKQIEENRKKHKAEIFAYCLMDNHVHFIVRPHDKKTLGALFGIAHMNYSLYFNKKNNSKGHLWQGRFYSCSLHGNHIQKAIRYVECNPVRANMVKRGWDYHWSSAKAHLGKKYNIIQLADINEYVDIDCWKTFLLETERPEQIDELRSKTRSGHAWGPEKLLESLSVEFGICLRSKKRGRPRRNNVCPPFCQYRLIFKLQIDTIDFYIHSK